MIEGARNKEVISEERFLRFERAKRIEHAALLISMTILALTGLPQKFPDAVISTFVIDLLGGIETTRIIHRTSAIILGAVAIYHAIAVAYRLYVRRISWSILPVLQDFNHLLQDLKFYFGLRIERARYDRYSYAEKVEYWAVVWGTVLMGVTGFMMWNPIATANLLPGQVIPAAKVAHGLEAILAVLSILIWHVYHVHLRHFNRSMFTGFLSREEMEDEHPTELERLNTGRGHTDPPRTVRRKREMIFFPIAAFIGAFMFAGLFAFVTFEQTSITTLPPGESAAAFSTRIPPATATLPPSPTPAEIQAASWNGGFEALFRNRCGNCHGVTSVGGLTVDTLEDALIGGNTGPGIVRGSPENSLLVQVQLEGDHPGQLTEDELTQVIEWIAAGAPEN
jgi:cytochrome b subunit of formate dehydrogenase/mono/diheme cytochrome c family protein